MRRSATLLLLLAGCSYNPQISGAPPGDDAASDSTATDTGTDGSMDPPPSACVQKWLDGNVTLSAPALVQGNFNSTDPERNPFLSNDELTIYFSSINGIDDDIFKVTRGTTGSPANNASVFATLSFLGAEARITMTADELTVFFASTRQGGDGGFDLWEAHRATTGSGFDLPTNTNTQVLNDGEDQTDPQISPDGLRIYYANGDPQKILVATRPDVGSPFSAGVELANIGAVDDADPALTADERVMVFTSTRGGGSGMTDLWFATRTQRGQPFGAPVHVPTVNGATNDRDPFVTADGCRVYFASDRGGNFDIVLSTVQ